MSLGDMRILSVRQPWASLIAHGYKDVENRKWMPRELGRIAIHASLIWSTLGEQYAQRLNVPQYVINMARHSRGRIVGTVEIAEIKSESTSGWYIDGHYAWMLKEPEPLWSEPVKGRLQFWKAPNLGIEYHPSIESPTNLAP